MDKKFAALAAGVVLLAGCQDQAGTSGAGTRDHIAIVGSSTVFPFAKAVSERYASGAAGRTAPVLESTGTGGGIEQFCAGIGPGTPDIANASRRMKPSEFESCGKNGVTDIAEVKIGIDGIAVAQSVKGPKISLTEEQIYKALAAKPFGMNQTARSWSDVDPSLPDIPIAVYGPPGTSGTRDAFEELILEKGCDTNAQMQAMKDSDKDRHDAICTEIRTDGAYKEQGENDNLIVQKLASNPDMMGVFGYSYMAENADKVRGIPIQGVAPTYDSIASGKYPGARPLFLYVKKAHVGKIPGLKEFVQEFVSAGGKDGYLAPLGLISLPDGERAASAGNAGAMKSIDASTLAG
ncbi:substrate-binding domain-containing protein [Novosphingopyxis sp.]|uniref:substrate-binding domain-containing protein n=1 Tax=Novosphingopyxis sp. TaxID=2709690 RepID=UPI003B5A8186